MYYCIKILAPFIVCWCAGKLPSATAFQNTASIWIPNPIERQTTKPAASPSTTTLFGVASRNEESFEDAVRRGWTPSRGSFSGLKHKTSSTTGNVARSMADTGGAVRSGGGTNVCIIKVVGVGGGGCNAVSVFVLLKVQYVVCKPLPNEQFTQHYYLTKITYTSYDFLLLLYARLIECLIAR